jgi:hypothetical protein
LKSIDPISNQTFIVSDSHRPFCIPTKHILVTRNRETKTFPKSTYATGDAGILAESQKKLHIPEQNRVLSGFRESNSEEIKKELAVNGLLKSRHPVNLKLSWLNPTHLHEFGLSR